MNKPSPYILAILVLGLLVSVATTPAMDKEGNTYSSAAKNEGMAAAEEDGASQPQDKSEASHTVEVALAIVPRLESGRLYFDVTTSLPDGMVFLATIVDDMGIINSTDTTLERMHAIVEKGEMIIGPFPSWEGYFPSGEYTLYLNSTPAHRQPGEVQAIIGERGENLSGQYVIKGAVILIKTFMVTGADRSR